MNFLITLIVFISLFSLMGIGFIVARKVLQKGCSMTPDDCACRREGKDPSNCDQEPSKKQQ